MRKDEWAVGNRQSARASGATWLARAALAVALVATLAGSARAGRLRLIVRNGSGTDRKDAPVTSGVPWPKGALASPDEVRLLNAEGEEVPLQVEALSRWSDGSVKWALLDLQASVPRQGSAGGSAAPSRGVGEAVYVLEYGPGVRRVAKLTQALDVDESDKAISVATGAAVFRVRKVGFNVLDEVQVSGQEQPVVRGGDETTGLRLEATEEMTGVKSPGHASFVQLRATDRVFLGRHRHGAEWFGRRGFRVLDAATGEELPLGVVGASLDPEGKQSVVGHGWCEGVFLHLSQVPRRHIEVRYPRAAAKPRVYTASLGPAEVKVETSGPVRAVVRAAGKFQAADGSTRCEYVARLHFYARTALVRLELTVVNRERMPLSRGEDIYPLLLSDLSLRLPLRLRGLKRFVFAGDPLKGATHRGDLTGVEDHAELVQFAGRNRRLSRYELLQGGRAVASGQASAGAVGLRDAVQGAVAVPQKMWAHNPKALRVRGDGSLEVGLLPREGGPTEGLLAGRARTHDVLLAFHGDARPDVLGLCAAFDVPLAAFAAPLAQPGAAGGEGRPAPYRGQWYAASGALPLAPLGEGDYEELFVLDVLRLHRNRTVSGAYGVWDHGAHGSEPCRVVDFIVERANQGSLESPALIGESGLEGMALQVTTGPAQSVGRTDPLIVASVDPAKGLLSFAKSLDPVPEKGSRALLYAPHGAFVCNRYDPIFAVVRESLRRGNPGLLADAWASARHLADVGTFHNVAGGDAPWTGAGFDPSLGPTSHHVPGLSRESSWYAGAWLTFLLTGDRAVLAGALANASFAARHADDPEMSPLAIALAAINLSFAADVGPAFAPVDAPAYRAALDTYIDRLLAAQRDSPDGLYGPEALVAGLAFEAFQLYQRIRGQDDERLAASRLQVADALIRPDRFWSGHEKIGRERRPDGGLVKPYGTADGLVKDRSYSADAAIHRPSCALVAPLLATVTEATGDSKYVQKARRLERVATLFSCSLFDDFALRYRAGDLFAAAWQRFREAHPSATDRAITLQCRFENAADVALPDIGEGGAVLFRPFVALPDGTRALQAQAPGASREPSAGAWFPLLGSANLHMPLNLESYELGALEFRICYRKGPGRRDDPWLVCGDPQRQGFSLGLKGDDLELVSRALTDTTIRIVHRKAKIETGRWHHVAFAWRPRWGVDLFLDGQKVGHSPRHELGFGRRLRFPCYPDDDTNEYLIDDLRVWKVRQSEFGAVADRKPPAAVTDLRIEPAAGGKVALSWTASGDDGKEGQARRYDIRLSSQGFHPISWGGYADTGDPIGAIHWAEADRVVPAPTPQPAGRLEKLLVGPLPRDRRVYIALKAEDEANASPLSNVVTNGVNHPPVADVGVPVRQTITGATVAFDARGSRDPDYDDLTYQWSNGIEGPTGTVVCDKPGAHDVTLTVSDGKAQATATTRLVVGNAIRVSFQPRGLKDAPEGFVPDTGGIYSQARGYGWRQAPRLQGFHRERPADLPTEARSGLALARGAEWLLDLPNGAYKLTVGVGDPARLEGRRRIFVEGKELFNVELTGSRRPHVAANHRIHLTDGQLNVHIGVPATPEHPTPEGGEINYLVVEKAD